jgi:hypothetical protein
MRKEWSVRLRLPEHQGRQIHEMALKESRSQSGMISILVAEALTARRSANTEVDRISRLIQGEAADYPSS